MDENWGLLGHEWAVAMLQNHLAKGRVRHAYLFSGPEGVGRRTLALRLAQALNCRQTTNPRQPCGECRDCQLLDRQEHPDLTIIAAEEGGRTIKVDQVREAQHSLSLTPFQARYRTAILLRVENAHLSAANALLKTLEEPPPQVVMMLTAQAPEALLPTIVSRCELVRLRPLPLAQLVSGLQAKYAFSEERANLLAHISGGRPGYAIRLHQNPEALTNRETWLSDLVTLFGTSRVKRFDYAEALAKDKERLEAQLQIWASFWRDVLLVSSGSAAALTNVDRAEQVNQLARRLSSQSARQLLQAVERTSGLLELNINTRLAVENLMLGMDGG